MIKLKNVSVKYKSEKDEQQALHNISLNIMQGECCVICGKSGCGKTTITRLINGLIPSFYSADVEGEIILNNKEISTLELSEISNLVGSVFQNPKSQFFNTNTTAELAFGCENLAWDTEKILNKMNESTKLFELQDLINRDIFSLSGGEKQRVACGSVYATEPQIFVLDEPSSNLDMTSIGKLKEIIKMLKKNGATIIISEHRLHYLKDVADKYIYLEQGEKLSEFRLDQLQRIPVSERNKMGLRMLDWDELSLTQKQKQSKEELSMTLREFSFSRKSKRIFYIPELSFERHSIIGIIGDNGVGKSTLISSMMGFLKYKGEIYRDNKKVRRNTLTKESFLVMQDVNRQLFSSSVLQEMSIGAKKGNIDASEQLLKEIGLFDVKDRHPASLSGGQKQRLAVASSIYSGKKYLFFDEPTSGLDKSSLISLSNMIMSLKEKSECIFIVTHDPELLVLCADYILKLDRDMQYKYYLMDKEGYSKTIDYFKESYIKANHIKTVIANVDYSPQFSTR